MGAFTPLKIIITEGAIGNVLQSLLKRYREGEAAARSWCCPAVPGRSWGAGAGGSELEPRRPGSPSAAAGSGTQPQQPREGAQRVRACVPRMGRWGLSLPGFDRVVFSGGVGSLVFQRLQTPFPKRRPQSLAWFPTRGGKNKCIKRNRSRKEPSREGASSACPAGEPRAGPRPRCVPREVGTGGPPPSTPDRVCPAAPRRNRALPEPGTSAPGLAWGPGGSARSRALGTAPGPRCPAPEPRAPSRSAFTPQRCGDREPHRALATERSREMPVALQSLRLPPRAAGALPLASGTTLLPQLLFENGRRFGDGAKAAEVGSGFSHVARWRF